jgi:hypothetical protein
MDKIVLIKENFNEISSIRRKIICVIEKIMLKISELKIIHGKLIKKKSIFTLGLDSLNFQNRLIDLEYENLNRTLKFIDNRIYRDYYKFYKLILHYVDTHVKDEKIKNVCVDRNYPVYRDLYPFQIYDFKHVIDMNYTITKIITEIHNFLIDKEQELKDDEYKSDMGLNIANYIYDSKHITSILEHQMNLYINYLIVFNKYHNKYLTRFSLKIKLMYGQIQNDIRLDEEIESVGTVELNQTEEEAIRTLINDDCEELDKVLSSVSDTSSPRKCEKQEEILLLKHKVDTCIISDTESESPSTEPHEDKSDEPHEDKSDEPHEDKSDEPHEDKSDEPHEDAKEIPVDTLENVSLAISYLEAKMKKKKKKPKSGKR